MTAARVHTIHRAGGLFSARKVAGRPGRWLVRVWCDSIECDTAHWHPLAEFPTLTEAIGAVEQWTGVAA